MQSPSSLLHLSVRGARLDRPESISSSLRVSFTQVNVAEADYGLMCQPALSLHIRYTEVVLGAICLLGWCVMIITYVNWPCNCSGGWGKLQSTR
jgi:hypothetical protein